MCMIWDYLKILLVWVDYDIKNNTLKLTQSNAVTHILKRYNMTESNGTFLPMEKGLKLERCMNKELLTKKPYRELIGSLMYLMLGSRPDLCYVISFYSRFQDAATDQHFNPSNEYYATWKPQLTVVMKEEFKIGYHKHLCRCRLC